ncbi:MAG: hypothetical protein WC977_03765 [Anaerovoracaceae bacterium]|jgi:hypothetical protein
MTGRTEATWEALRRDGWTCQRHLHLLGVVRDGGDGHHLFGRQVDVPEAIIALCHDCHMQLHGGQIDRREIIRLQIDRGVMSEEHAENFDRIKTGGSGTKGG